MASMTLRIKFLFFTAWIYSSSQIFAQEMEKRPQKKGNPLIICLGNEEERLHLSKTTGPVYHLNQLFINEFAGANDIRLKSQYLKKTCASKSFSPSVLLLRLIMLKGADIFELGDLDLHQKGMAEELAERSAHIFFNYLAGLQGMTADPQCLNKKIPEIKEFSERFQYLESDRSEHQILKDNKKINIIFNKLKKFDTIVRECEIEAKREQEKKESTGPGK